MTSPFAARAVKKKKRRMDDAPACVPTYLTIGLHLSVMVNSTPQAPACQGEATRGAGRAAATCGQNSRSGVGRTVVRVWAEQSFGCGLKSVQARAEKLSCVCRTAVTRVRNSRLMRLTLQVLLRVLGLAVDVYLEVQVWAGRKAGLSDLAYGLPPVHRPSFLDVVD